jgi:hypothetical protein
MASDANRENGVESRRQNVAPAAIDEMLLDALDALEQTRVLHENTPNPETKRQAKRIVASLHSSLTKLAPLGVHSMRRLQTEMQRMPAAIV